VFQSKIIFYFLYCIYFNYFQRLKEDGVNLNLVWTPNKAADEVRILSADWSADDLASVGPWLVINDNITAMGLEFIIWKWDHDIACEEVFNTRDNLLSDISDSQQVVVTINVGVPRQLGCSPSRYERYQFEVIFYLFYIETLPSDVLNVWIWRINISKTPS